MHKRIIIVVVLIFCFIFYGNVIEDNEIEINTIFKIKFPEVIKVDFQSKNIFKKNNDLMIRYSYSFEFKKKSYSFYIYLKPHKRITIHELEKKFDNTNIRKATTGFGIGNEYKLILKNYSSLKKIKAEKLIITKYAREWGSHLSRDILCYHFILNDNMIEECLIEFFNLWPENIDYPNNYDVHYIDDLINERNEKSEIFMLLDEVLTRIKLLI